MKRWKDSFENVINPNKKCNDDFKPDYRDDFDQVIIDIFHKYVLYTRS